MTSPLPAEDAIYIATSRGQEGPYPPEQVRNLWNRGLLPESARYWRQGMVDWLPVREFVDAPVAAPPLPSHAAEHTPSATSPASAEGSPEAASPVDAPPLRAGEAAGPPAHPAPSAEPAAGALLAGPAVLADPPVVRLVTHTGEYGPYTDAQMRAMWMQGQLPRDAFVWAPGMAEWRPVAEYVMRAPPTPTGAAVAPDPAAQAAQAAVVVAATVAPLGPLTSALSGVAIAGAVFAGLRALSEVGRLVDLQLLGRLDRVAEYQFRTAVLAGFQGLLAAAALALFCFWLYRAARNLRGMGARGLRFSPEWAVGWLFVPLLNSFRPFEVVAEVARASARPSNWQDEPVPSAITRWWMLWLLYVLGYLLAWMAARAAEPASLAPPLNSLAVSLVGLATWLALRRAVSLVGGLQAEWLAGAHTRAATPTGGAGESAPGAA
ncbi:MAG TPA: GYF domain-containing protein, partial [Chthonomonadales bacterium]|nr:GYF domain-containing protein [Chthonomonadales bacterium]